MNIATVTATLPETIWANYRAWACQQAGYADPAALPVDADSIAILRLVGDAQQVGGSWAVQNAVKIATVAAQVEQDALPTHTSGTVEVAPEPAP